MKNHITVFVTTVVLFFLMFPAISSAAVITFDLDPPALQQGYGEGSIYEEEGYFLSTSNDPGHSGSIIRFNPDAVSGIVPNNGSIHMGATHFSNPWLQKSDGGAFDLISLEVAEYSAFVTPPQSLNISGLTVNGLVLSTNLFIDDIFDGAGGVDDFQFYSLNWTNLVRLDFNDTGFSIDNIEVNSATVPEPELLSLLVIGWVGLGFLRKMKAT